MDADETTGESPSTAPEPAAAPAVTLLMVTHDPGAWFDDVLAAIAALEYPALEVVVVDADSTVPVSSRIAVALPEATVVRLDENLGFGRSIDAALARITLAPLVILAHDDVAPDRTAVRALVEEAFRSNAALVGPKVVRWNDTTRLLAAGEGADKFGFPVSYVERGELDQEQHDAVRDVFNVPDAFTLVRSDILRALGGFDDEAGWFGDDLDLCWRVHVAGGRVLVAPGARVRHIEALAERRPVDDRRRQQFRHRLRTVLTVYRPVSLVRVLPQLAVLHLVEALFSLLTGRPGQARDVLSSWSWNLGRLGSLRQRRAALQAVRKVPDADIRPLQVGGSARVAAFLRGQLAVGDDPFGSAATVSRRMIDAVAGPGRRAALVAWIVVGLVVLIGSRHLITRPIPAIGDLVAFPEHVGPILSEWASSWRRAGIGGEGFAATGNLLAGAGVALFLGAGGLLRTLLILGMLPLGLFGVWRLVAPSHSVRASVVALFAYAAIPVGYDSLATGSWRGLVGYGVMPWVFARVLRASGDVPFGAADPPAGPRVEIPPLWRQSLALGVVIALAATIDPLWVAWPAALVVAMIPGSLVAGRLSGLARMLLTSIGAGVIALILHAPWAIEMLSPGGGWSAFTGGRVADSRALGILEITRFDTGPIGSSGLHAAVALAAAYVLVVGRGWRLAWAARAWSIALVSWGLLWASGRGWLPVALPPTEMGLAPAGVAMAMSVGLGAAAFDADVRRRKFSWRQFASFVAVASLAVSFLPTLAAAVGGRWLMPRGEHRQVLAFLDAEAATDDFRVVWLGSPEVLPLTGWPLLDGLAYATTQDGTPVLQDLWPGPADPSDAPLPSALDLAISLDTTRLGRILAPMGVRYLVVVDRSAPAPYGGTSAPVPDEITAALEQQLDLVRIDVNPVLSVYRNAAWSPMFSVVPDDTIPEAPEVAMPDGMRQAARLRLSDEAGPLGMDGPSSASGEVPSGSEILIGSAPSTGWRADVDGDRVPTRPVLGWTSAAVVDEGGRASIAWVTPVVHRAALAGQIAAALVVVAVMYLTRAEQRELRRRRRTPRRGRRR
ncbi:MAG: glycosyltransferase family 2 protein [Acidimicrobiia bacterium]|nr:glycosyltransferase family 2 protein [Acidimicrobiia bacterium]